MKRRNFIQLGTITCTIPFLGIKASVRSETNEEMVSSGNEQSFELEEWTVDELQKAMESGKYSSRQICALYLKRIKEKDQSENGLNSVIELNPDALLIADQLDLERSEGNVRGPLHGIPVMIKDNIDTGDKMMTTAGSFALAGSTAPDDAFIVERLREAGVVLLGKTNLSEWANFRSSRSSSGWSGRGGQTKNPFALDRNPCGSSSGSGAAVSGNMCAIAIGTETNGSIVCPSSANGVVGIKPTVGLWSRDGIIPISETQDTAGPMARTVKDAAILLGACVGVDEADIRTRESEGNFQTDYTQFLDEDALKGKRLGLLKDAYGSHEKSDEVLKSAVEVLKTQGAEVIEEVEIWKQSDFEGTGDVLYYEFKNGLNKYLASRPDVVVKTLKDVIQFNKDHFDKEMPYFLQERMDQAQALGSLEDQEYKDALAKMLKVAREKYDAKLNELNLDAFMALTRGPAWKTDLLLGDNFRGGVSSSTPAARSGYPNVTVPAGFVLGLPVGLSFFSGKYQEPKLISIAYAFEQATKVRKAPKLISSLELT
ncbi:MAG: amidase [Ekhidna sp.]|nr:amidase [Ekhidna sp.]